MLNWQWKYDATQEQLHILMSGGLMQTLSYRKKHLRPDMPALCDFSLEDATFHANLMDYQDTHSTLSPTAQLLTALHATAIQRFGKALMPQSWHFQTGMLESWPEEHKYCALNSGFAKGSFLRISGDTRTSLCMLIDQSFEVATTKQMKRFEVVRVLNDRLLSNDLHAITNQGDDWQQFA
ncbi:cell division protein ZapC domain-containing protein [Aliidiomarina quisquiliarum]|uniref:cell division protein ZapC domain-containing protein n=1 Tax=Aliidiomarina quisquiliarum TaxID=2938947 RepID=UPI00208F8456|nr:cell division protein ZapC domain-containing protein [Aliidiomarina quisquiliarum]MCO4320747.1 cell division protein ZapC [Aliidiomarina quisquiliarum]